MFSQQGNKQPNDFKLQRRSQYEKQNANRLHAGTQIYRLKKKSTAGKHYAGNEAAGAGAGDQQS